MATKSKPKSEASDLFKKMMGKLKGYVATSGILVIILSLVFPLIGWIRSTPERAETNRTQASVERSTQAAQQQEAARLLEARTDATRRAIEGTWRIVDGWDSTVYVGDYQLDRSGGLVSFEFEYSFRHESKDHANTWQCSRSQDDRYNCTYRQRWDGGSLRGEALLERTSDNSFTGRYLYQNQWQEITFRKEGV